MEDDVLLDGSYGPVGRCFWFSGFRLGEQAPISGGSSSNAGSSNSQSTHATHIGLLVAVMIAFIFLACLSFTFSLQHQQLVSSGSPARMKTNKLMSSLPVELATMHPSRVSTFNSITSFLVTSYMVIALLSTGMAFVGTPVHTHAFHQSAYYDETMPPTKYSPLTRKNAIICIVAALLAGMFTMMKGLVGCKSTSQSACPSLPVPWWSPVQSALLELVPQLSKPFSQKRCDEWFTIFCPSRQLIRGLGLSFLPYIGSMLGTMADMQSPPRCMPTGAEYSHLGKSDLDTRKAVRYTVFVLKLITLVLLQAFASHMFGKLCVRKLCQPHVQATISKFQEHIDKSSDELSSPFETPLETPVYAEQLGQYHELVRGAVSKLSRVAWEYYNVLIDWIRSALTATCIVKRIVWDWQAALQDSTMEVALLFAPVLGNEVMFAKEM